ncbi:hypothetical protein G4B88_008227 [Cannabis sativa]|uniref:Disease resistance N-terminal domain-containing protein n=1 Tax=Cannabis sativa TaxID=3483 RepID=A0A7J6FLC9_CANSA|nr:hypothetical protein G4B88_008227 [Cannabis sativa]
MAELVIGAVISSSLDFLLKRVASPYCKEFFKENESSVVSERLFKLKSTLNCLATVRFEVENKRIKNPAVENWLEDLLDVVDDAEDFFGDIEYNAMKPNKPDELKKAKRKAICKLLSRFSKPSNSADRKRNTNMVEILKRLEYLADQIGYLNLEKNVVEVKPSERLRAKTSLPDEPEIYESLYQTIKPMSPTSTYHPLQSLWLEDCGSSFRSLQLDLFPNLKTLTITICDYFEALSVSDGKSLQELTSLSSLQIDSCCSFVSFPKGGLIAPKLSEFTISNCPKLKWLPEKMALLSSLKLLILFHCPLMETFPEGGMPASASCFVMHDLIVDLARTISGKYNCFLQQNDDIDRLEKKTRHLGCHPESLYEAINPSKPSSTSSGGSFPTTLTPLYHYPPLQSLRLEDCGSSFRSLDMELFPNLKTLYIQSSHYFEAISMSNGKSLEELTSLSIWHCDSFVSFPNGGFIAPKLSKLEIVNCRKLKWLPEKLSSLSSLESLTIDYCPLIETFPEGEGDLPIASPYVEEFFKGKNESSSVVSERLFKLKSTFNCLAAVRFEVENKRIKNPAVEKWLGDLLDAVDDAEDFFGDIAYDAMNPNKVDESKKEKRKDISKLLSCFSKPSNSTGRVRNANMEEILKRLEYFANQIGNLNLEKNVDEMKPSESSRAKTSLPDEPELCVSLSFLQPIEWDKSYCVMHDLIVDLARTISGKYICLLEQNDNTDRLEKKTRHNSESLYEAIKPRNPCSTSTISGCLPTTLIPLYHYPPLHHLELYGCGSSFKSLNMDLFPNLKTLEIECNDYFEAISMSNGKSLEELTSLRIVDCGSFVSFPSGGLTAPKLSNLGIVNCPKLKWLPEKMTSLSALKSLTIKGCPLIKSLPEGGLSVISFSFLQPSKWGVSCFVMHDLIVDLARTISGKYSCLLEQTDSIDRLEEKTRHLGCVRELYNDNKIASYDFGATRLRTFAIKPRNPCSTVTPLQSLRLAYCGSSFRSLDMDLFPNLKTLWIESSDYFEGITVSDGKSLEELTSLSIKDCDSFVSFPNGGLIAPKLSHLEIRRCPKLKWLPEKMTSLSALKDLQILYCPLIELFPEGEGGLPVSLSRLGISVCLGLFLFKESLFLLNKNPLFYHGLFNLCLLNMQCRKEDTSSVFYYVHKNYLHNNYSPLYSLYFIAVMAKHIAHKEQKENIYKYIYICTMVNCSSLHNSHHTRPVVSKNKSTKQLKWLRKRKMFTKRNSKSKSVTVIPTDEA